MSSFFKTICVHGVARGVLKKRLRPMLTNFSSIIYCRVSETRYVSLNCSDLHLFVSTDFLRVWQVLFFLNFNVFSYSFLKKVRLPP